MSPSGWHPPHGSNTEMLYLGDQHCQQTVLKFLDESQSPFFVSLLFRLSIHFYTYFDVIMRLICLLYNLIYHHSSVDFLYETIYCL